MSDPTPAPGGDPLDGVPTTTSDAASSAHVARVVSAPSSRTAPRRYPLIGILGIVAFIVTSILVTSSKQLSLLGIATKLAPGAMGGGKGASEPSTLPLSTQQTLARMAADLRKLECLERFDWDRPDHNCRTAILQVAGGFDGYMDELGAIDVSKDSELRELVSGLVVFRERVRIVEIVQAAPGPAPMNVDQELRFVMLNARGLRLRIEEFVSAEDQVLALSPLNTGLKVMTGEDPTGLIEGMDDRSEGDDRPELAPPPAPIRPEGAPLPTPEPVEAAPATAATPAAAAPATPRDTAAEVALIVATVRESHAALERCSRSHYEVPECVTRARASLARADERLAAFRALNTQDAAVAQARKIDAAIGRMRRTTAAFASASQVASTQSPEDSIGGNPFAAAEAQLREAAGVIDAAGQ